jgi:ATP-dependent Zn protease
MKLPSRRLQRVAYHEAGHAFASIKLRRGLVRVTIEPNEDYLGHSLDTLSGLNSVIRDDANSYRVAEREILILLSGLAAEHRFAGNHNWRGAGHDFESAADLALRIHGNAKLARRMSLL